MTDDNTDELPQQHGDDILRVGDEVPWHGAMAEVTDRKAAAQIPDDIPEWMEPRSHRDVEQDTDAEYVLLTIEDAGGETHEVVATWLVRDMGASFNEHGLPDVQSKLSNSVGMTGKTKVQTPATGDNHLDAEDARRLAEFLREHREFGPLWALLGQTDSPEDMDAIADALDRAATVREYRERLDDD